MIFPVAQMTDFAKLAELAILTFRSWVFKFMKIWIKVLSNLKKAWLE